MPKILNIDILSITKDDLLSNLTKGVLYTPNLDHMFRLQHDEEFYNAYKQAEWVICDSRILHHVSKLLKHPIKEAIPGSSFFCDFYNYHKNDPDYRIFLLGSVSNGAIKAMHRINETVGYNIVIGAHSPSFVFEKDETESKAIVDMINSSGANVLVIGISSPKQEKWIAKYRHDMPKVKLFMALGATIDFEAGIKKRAPITWQKMNLEWLYRFLCEPKRLFRRYFIDDVRFFWYFGKQLFGRYRNPWTENCKF